MIGKGPLKNPSGNGLELDKLEVPARAMPETVRQPTADSERKPTPSPGTGSSGKKTPSADIDRGNSNPGITRGHSDIHEKAEPEGFFSVLKKILVFR